MAKHKIVEGLYDLVVNAETEAQLATSDLEHALDALSPETLPELLTWQLSRLLQNTLESVKGKTDTERVAKQLALANAIVDVLRHAENTPIHAADRWTPHAKRLLSVTRPPRTAPERPSIALTANDLLVNGRREPNLGHELRRELASADRVDVIVAFLKFSGLRILRDALQEFLTRRPSGLRLLTTTYMGATDQRAVDELVAMGADVRVSYDAQTTRLHAKAWLFHRESGFSTGYVGSSNLSHAAMLDGMEWNVRVSAIDSPVVLEKFSATFDQYWDGGDFESYDPAKDAGRLAQALGAHQRRNFDELTQFFDVRPRPHQKQILEALESERRRGHTRNLVVAATGTGKTLVSAFDYARLRRENGTLKLLFVAHRKEILKQSQFAFRMVTKDGNFGELWVDGQRPVLWHHVFASIQSLQNNLEAFARDHFDVVVIDEFHHAEAPTYQRVLEHFQPRWLVGLTATPERADGLDVKRWFDGRIAAEIRLWDALEQNLLVPFQYFGVTDTVDFEAVKFSGRTYDRTALGNVLSGDSVRARWILQAVDRYIEDPRRMRALGFCVTVSHAQLMADVFSRHGIHAVAVHATSDASSRQQALRDLRDGKLQVIFSVDLFNEGLDVPAVDTVLFLRPTESATIFLQQLGRGLRIEENKECLTVLDFVGNAHKRYRFDQKFRAFLGGNRQQITEAIEQDFPYLPPGCSIQLEKNAKENILKNIRSNLGADRKILGEEIRLAAAAPGFSLLTFLNDSGLGLDDLYARPNHSLAETVRKVDGSWPEGDLDSWRGVSKLQFVDDYDLVRRWSSILERDAYSLQKGDEIDFSRLLSIVHKDFTRLDTLDAYGRALWDNLAARYEIREVLNVLEDRIRRVTIPTGIDGVPLGIHGTYSRNEIMAALGQFKDGTLKQPREGVVWASDIPADLLFITLNKSDGEYSPKTMYRDFPMSERLFHWESQHTTPAGSTTGQRYQHHAKQGSHVFLFVRDTKKTKTGFTLPYTFLGPATYVNHTSERPMQIVWRLEHEMPADIYQASKIAAG